MNFFVHRLIFFNLSDLNLFICQTFIDLIIRVLVRIWLIILIFLFIIFLYVRWKLHMDFCLWICIGSQTNPLFMLVYYLIILILMHITIPNMLLDIEGHLFFIVIFLRLSILIYSSRRLFLVIFFFIWTTFYMFLVWIIIILLNLTMGRTRRWLLWHFSTRFFIILFSPSIIITFNWFSIFI